MNHWTGVRMVAEREIRERLRSRVFRASTIISALAVVAIIVLPNLKKDEKTVYDVGLVNVTNPLVEQSVRAAGPAVGATLRVHVVDTVIHARSEIRTGALDIALVESQTILVKRPADPARLSKRLRLQAALAEASRLPTALTEAGLSPAQITKALTAPPLKIEAQAKPKQTSSGALATTIIGVIATFIFLQTFGQWVLNGVAEEKSSRIAEVLLAALRPRQLVTGKILGIGALGFIQASVVAVSAIVASHAVHIDVLAGTKIFYAIGAVGWFALGFAFYGWAFAAAGSLVSRQAEAGAAAFPIMIPMLAGYIAASTSFGATEPNSLVRALAYVPPTAPLCMPVLIADGAVAPWQVALSVGGVLLSVFVMARVASAIYSNSILRTGKRIKWMEALRAA